MFRVCFLVVWIAAVCFAGKWSEWQNASLCTAEPCGCSDWDKTPCKRGTKLQIRYCNHAGSDAISPCAYDDKNNGPIRKIDCKAEPKENCPGWSNWEPITDCKCEPYEKTGRQPMQRLCNNPAPIYGDKLCATVDGGFVDVQKEEVNCNCTDIVTTTTTKKPDVVRECCCKIEGFYDNPDPEPETKAPNVFGGRRRRQADDSPDYQDNCIKKKEDPKCCEGKTTPVTPEPKPKCCCELEGEGEVVDAYSDCITNEVDPNCCTGY